MEHMTTWPAMQGLETKSSLEAVLTFTSSLRIETSFRGDTKGVRPLAGPMIGSASNPKMTIQIDQ
jgi:hypothetical protein